MALSENSDYVFCPKVTFLSGAGMGTGCLVGTKNMLLSLPTNLLEAEVLSASQTTIVTTYKVAGVSPSDAIPIIAKEMDTVEQFEEILVELASGDSDGVLVKLDEIKRLNVKASWFSKAVYYSDREKGPGWKALGLGKKPLALAFMAFYQDHPRHI